tara:strand:- start:419 stop:1582 length:1164 start_codon:yes stop_codon:yes gene_type:complete
METEHINMLEFMLPDITVVSEFLSLPEKTKIQILELGMFLHNKKNEKLQFLNNKDWQEKIQNIEKQHNDNEESLKMQIQKLETIQNDLSELHRREKNELILQTKETEQLKSQANIDRLQEENENTSKKLKELMENYQNLHYTLTERHDKKQEEIRANYETKITELNKEKDRIRDNYEEKLLAEKQKSDDMALRTTNSTLKGQEGENFSQHQLNCLFPKAEIEDCHKTPERGDFILREKEFNMMVEIKNYNTNVGKKEIQKFYRDIGSESNSDIQCGVFISLSTGIANKEDLSIEFINKKPVIFLHKLQKNMDHLLLSVKFLKILVQQKDLDCSNSEIIAALKDILSESKRNFNRQKKRIDKFYKEQKEDILDQENCFQKIFQKLSIK